jgi:hypothetical protein
MNNDDKIKRLPVRFKKPPGEDVRTLKLVDSSRSRGECNHKWFVRSSDGLNGRMINVTYLIREGETEVECGNCHAKLDPMWVLRRLAGKETQWENAKYRYHEEMQRLSERSITQCDHCGKMTRISRAKAK